MRPEEGVRRPEPVRIVTPHVDEQLLRVAERCPDDQPQVAVGRGRPGPLRDPRPLQEPADILREEKCLRHQAVVRSGPHDVEAYPV